MLKFADIFNKGPNFNPMQFIRKSRYILTPKTPLIGRLGGPEARMSTVLPNEINWETKESFYMILSYDIHWKTTNSSQAYKSFLEFSNLIFM